MSKKRQRQQGKRAYLKRFSATSMNGGRLNRNLVQFGSSQFSRGQYTEPPTTRYSKGRVPDVETPDRVPVAQSLQLKNIRSETLQRFVIEWQTSFWQGKEEFQHQKMPDKFPDITIHKFFSGPQVFFIGEHKTSKVLVRSVVYTDMKVADAAFRHDSVRWSHYSSG